MKLRYPPAAHLLCAVRSHARHDQTRLGNILFFQQVKQARDRGFRVEIHAIGDRALASVLDACEEAGLTAEDRPIVTHCQVEIACSGVHVLSASRKTNTVHGQAVSESRLGRTVQLLLVLCLTERRTGNGAT